MRFFPSVNTLLAGFGQELVAGDGDGFVPKGPSADKDVVAEVKSSRMDDDEDAAPAASPTAAAAAKAKDTYVVPSRVLKTNRVHYHEDRSVLKIDSTKDIRTAVKVGEFRGSNEFELKGNASRLQFIKSNSPEVIEPSFALIYAALTSKATLRSNGINVHNGAIDFYCATFLCMSRYVQELQQNPHTMSDSGSSRDAPWQQWNAPPKQSMSERIAAAEEDESDDKVRIRLLTVNLSFSYHWSF